MATAMIRVLIAVGLLAGNCAYARAAGPSKEKYVRVAISSDIHELKFSIRGKYKIIDPASGALLQEGRNLRESRISFHPDGITINDKKYPLRRIRLASSKDVALTWMTR